jgi:hypothetical protein
MTIEVRQILIKAAVTKRLGEAETRADAVDQREALKAEILEECRRLVVDLLREDKER